MRRFVAAIAALISAAVVVAVVNYALVHHDMRMAIESDDRNSGLVFYAYHENFVVPGTIVIDLRGVSVTNSQADVFRLLLQFAAKQKDKTYQRVILAFRGDPRFILKGEYFKKLGQEYETQNPVYTMRTFSENVLNVDGMPAFGAWTGGFVGVLGKQMEDFTELHHRWYIRSLAHSGAK